VIEVLAGHLLIMLLGLPLLSLIQRMSIGDCIRGPQHIALGYLLGEFLAVAILFLGNILGLQFSAYTIFGGALALWSLHYYRTYSTTLSATLEKEKARYWWATAFALGILLLPAVPQSWFFPVVAWDARSIWFFHGKAFFSDGGISIDFLTNPSYLWSHPDYPPGLPILAAYHALFLDTWDEVLCKSFLFVHWYCALLSLSASLNRRGTPIAVTTATIIFLHLFLGENIIHGYADSLMVSLLLLGALEDSAKRRICFVGFACLVKAEAIPFVAVFLLVRLLQLRFARSALLETLAVVAIAIPWKVFCYFHSIAGEYSWSLAAALRLSPEQLQRRMSVIGEFAQAALLGRLGISGVSLLGLAIILPLFFAFKFRHQDTLLIWATYLGSMLVVFVMYLTAPVPLPWLLENSFLRVCYFSVSLAIVLLALCIALLVQGSSSRFGR
jgi:hypothetical protein